MTATRQVMSSLRVLALRPGVVGRSAKPPGNFGVQITRTLTTYKTDLGGDTGREDLFRKYPPAPGAIVRQAWLETLNADSTDRSGEIVSLHPEVWSVRPRIDLIKENVDWQLKYKTVSYVHARGRHELPGGSKRPWPQKGTGRARHASIRSPIWVQGGKAHGPKNPRSYFYMIPYHNRVQGLIHTLSVKFAQDDVHIVSDLEIPTNDAKYIEDLVDERGWGLSTLMVGLDDFFPANLTAATDPILHVNLLPVYGLNVHSMLKHKTLVLSLDALTHLEERLLFALRRNDIAEKSHKSRVAKSSPFH